MATTRIDYDVSTPFGAMAARLASLVIEAQQTVVRLKGALEAMNSIPGTDATVIEAELGIATGLGDDFYTIIVNANANLGTAVTEMKKIDQGLAV